MNGLVQLKTVGNSFRLKWVMKMHHFFMVSGLIVQYFLSEFYETWVTLISNIMSHDGQYHTMPSRVIALCSSKKSFFGF